MTRRPASRLSVVGGAWERDGDGRRGPWWPHEVTNFKSKATFLSGHQGEWADDDAFTPQQPCPVTADDGASQLFIKSKVGVPHSASQWCPAPRLLGDGLASPGRENN